MVLVQTTLDGARLETNKILRNLENIELKALAATSALQGTLGIARRLTGDENLQRGMATMQRTVGVAQQLTIALTTLQAARMAAGDPLAWVTAGLAVGGATLSLYDVIGR